MNRRRWRLRTGLIGLLSLISLISFLLAGATLFLIRLPQISRESQEDLRVEVSDLSLRSEAMLGAIQTQLELIATALRNPGTTPEKTLERALGRSSAFTAIYQVDRDGTVINASLKSWLGHARRRELIGNDLSRDPIFQRTVTEARTVWSDKYLSPVSSEVAVSIGTPAGDTVIIGEIALAHIMDTLRVASGRRDLMVWIIDRNGEILADSENAARVGVVNLRHLPLLTGSHHSGSLADTLSFEGKTFDAALAHSHLLDWYFVIRSPGGLANPRIASTVDLWIAVLGITLALGVVLAPLWATRMARPIAALAQRARSIANGETPGPWPRGRIVEFDELSRDLERMADSLRAQKQELEAVFNASPVGMIVLDPQVNYVFVRVNDACSHLLAATRDQLVGKTGKMLNLWCNANEREQFYHALQAKQFVELETRARRLDGSEFIAALSVSYFITGGQRRALMVVRDVTELRRIEAEIRALNSELEQRVERRTAELFEANARLSTTIEHLKLTQAELVRSEKLASLGALVAGVAHELNTPLGNGVMALSTLIASLRTFRKEMESGIKRSSLDKLLEAMDTGSDIAFRNLSRAAELVASFKQVAADQSSSQRRAFLLEEVVDEIVLTVRPLLKRGDVAISVDVAQGLSMDSFPGPLGQVITNLISNAVTHAFEDCDDRRVTIAATPDGDEAVCITLADNGNGIPDTLLPRIFDPFVTTRMGRGGVGLGLHICHNLVMQTLGGRITVASTPGVGTTFTLTLPTCAPAPSAANEQSAHA